MKSPFRGFVLCHLAKFTVLGKREGGGGFVRGFLSFDTLYRPRLPSALSIVSSSVPSHFIFLLSMNFVTLKELSLLIFILFLPSPGWMRRNEFNNEFIGTETDTAGRVGKLAGRAKKKVGAGRLPS